MQLEQVPIEHPRDQNLREWLHRSEFDILLEVLASMAFTQEAEAANALTKWNGGEFPDYRDSALATAFRVREINRAIEILKSLREQKEPYSRCKATPT